MNSAMKSQIIAEFISKAKSAGIVLEAVVLGPKDMVQVEGEMRSLALKPAPGPISNLRILGVSIRPAVISSPPQPVARRKSIWERLRHA